MITKLDGQKIKSVSVQYEHIYVIDDKENGYILTTDDLGTILNEFLFNVEKKRVRTYLHPVLPEVDLLYNQETYNNYNENNEDKNN